MPAGATLAPAKTNIENRLRVKKLGSPHWVEMKEHMDTVATAWLDKFFSGPLMFFVYAPARAATSRLDLVTAVIERLERDPRVPYGLERSSTTIHLDYDHQDAQDLDMRLVRDFRLLRAFHWNDRGSPLLQLADLLLGMSSRLHSPRSPPASDAEARRLGVMASAKARYVATGGKNMVVAYEPDGGLRDLLT